MARFRGMCRELRGVLQGKRTSLISSIASSADAALHRGQETGRRADTGCISGCTACGTDGVSGASELFLGVSSACRKCVAKHLPHNLEDLTSFARLLAQEGQRRRWQRRRESACWRLLENSVRAQRSSVVVRGSLVSVFARGSETSVG